MDNLRGAAIMVLAMLGFAIEDMFIKMLAGAVPVGQILMLLGTGGSLIFAVIVRLQGRALFERAMWSGPVLTRAAGEIIGTVGFVNAIVFTTLSSASAILQATPLVVTLGAAVFLSEPVGWRRWSAILIGFFGVLMIVRPGLAGFTPLSLFAVLGVLGLAVRDLATRKTTKSLSTMQLSFLGFLAIVPAGAGLIAFGPDVLTPMSLRSLAIMSIALVIGVVAYYGIVAAMRVGDISFVTPFRYTRLIFALILGASIFGDRPDKWTLIGAAIIVASGIYTVWRERRIKAQP
ncbi:EamA family transporter [Pseudosulfitobacter sp. SM2401]|jgi:drug/metabolite transporter (DMT)-like permease|uniref:DMT family transporter n=1 Tax=Pseudosulfitobacter sp. SM2401 TaxID=3350098 RepID=UPI0036F24040